MAEAVLVDSFRERIAAHMAGGATLPAIGYMAFGDGGHNASTLEPIPPSSSATALNHEVLRKAISSITQEDTLSVTGVGTVETTELVGTALSECALLDTEGNVIGIKTFSPKVKEADERYQISIKLRF